MTKLSNAADEDHWSGSRFPHLPKPQPTNAAPPKREWAKLITGVRIEGYCVVVVTKNNETAHQLCHELLKEKNGY